MMTVEWFTLCTFTPLKALCLNLVLLLSLSCTSVLLLLSSFCCLCPVLPLPSLLCDPGQTVSSSTHPGGEGPGEGVHHGAGSGGRASPQTPTADVSNKKHQTSDLTLTSPDAAVFSFISTFRKGTQLMTSGFIYSF